MALGNPAFDTLASTTLDEHSRTLANNVFDAQPFMFFLNQAGRMVNWQGGKTIVEPLIHGRNTTTVSYAGYDTLPTGTSAGLTSAQYDIKKAATAITISGEEEMLNSGTPEQVINLLETKIMQAQESAVEYFDEELITSDGTGNSGKDFQGLELIIGGEFVSPTCGGIDASDALNDWWRSEISDGGYGAWVDAGSPGPAPAARALLLSEMSNVYNTISNGPDQPQLIMTTQGLYESYESLLLPNQRFRDEKTADAGFTNLLFKGTPIVYDNYVASGEMFFLNFNNGYIKMRKRPERWFTTTPFMRPYNQDAKVAQVLYMGELTINNRRRQGLMSNLINS